MAAPRLKRSRSSSPPTSPAITSPLDQLVKRRARQAGKSPLAKENVEESDEWTGRNGQDENERRPKRRRRQGLVEDYGSSQSVGSRGFSLQGIGVGSGFGVNGVKGSSVRSSGMVMEATVNERHQQQRTPESAPVHHAYGLGKHPITRTISEPLAPQLSHLLTPLPVTASSTSYHGEAGGGRVRVQRVASLWDDEQETPEAGTSGAMRASSSSPFPPDYNSPYAESNTLLHQLHLARLQPHPSPNNDTMMTSSPMQTPSRPSMNGYFPNMRMNDAGQSTNGSFNPIGSPIPGPSLAVSPESLSRYPYLSRTRSRSVSMDSSSITSENGEDDIDEDDEDDIALQTPGRNSGAEWRNNNSRSSQQPLTRPTHQPSYQEPYTPHRAFRPASTSALSFTSSRLSANSNTASPRSRNGLTASRVPTPQVPRPGRGPTAPLPAHASAEAEETRRRYEEANRLLGGLVVGRRSQTEARGLHHTKGRTQLDGDDAESRRPHTSTLSTLP